MDLTRHSGAPTMSKCKVKTVQVLAGHLNFVTRAVPHGNPFSRKMYDLIAGIKPHWHISITKEVKRDLCIWKKVHNRVWGLDTHHHPYHVSATPLHRRSNNNWLRLRSLVGYSLDLGSMGPRVHANQQSIFWLSWTVCCSSSTPGLDPPSSLTNMWFTVITNPQ